MRIGECLDQWRWRAYVAMTVLAALLLPAMSGATCLQADLAPARVAVSPVPPVDQATEVVRVAPEPTKKPASRPRHAVVCQHAHCCHAQIALEAEKNVGAAVPGRGPLPGWTVERFAKAPPIAGPERPPQA